MPQPPDRHTDPPEPAPAPEDALVGYLMALTNPGLFAQGHAATLRIVRAAAARLRLYEGALARDAVERGMSWTELGRAIGLSRQAAQRRYQSDPETFE